MVKISQDPDGTHIDYLNKDEKKQVKIRPTKSVTINRTVQVHEIEPENERPIHKRPSDAHTGHRKNQRKTKEKKEEFSNAVQHHLTAVTAETEKNIHTQNSSAYIDRNLLIEKDFNKKLSEATQNRLNDINYLAAPNSRTDDYTLLSDISELQDDDTPTKHTTKKYQRIDADAEISNDKLAKKPAITRYDYDGKPYKTDPNETDNRVREKFNKIRSAKATNIDSASVANTAPVQKLISRQSIQLDNKKYDIIDQKINSLQEGIDTYSSFTPDADIKDINFLNEYRKAIQNNTVLNAENGQKFKKIDDTITAQAIDALKPKQSSQQEYQGLEFNENSDTYR